MNQEEITRRFNELMKALKEKNLEKLHLDLRNNYLLTLEREQRITPLERQELADKLNKKAELAHELNTISQNLLPYATKYVVYYRAKFIENGVIVERDFQKPFIFPININRPYNINLLKFEELPEDYMVNQIIGAYSYIYDIIYNYEFSDFNITSLMKVE